MDNEPKEDNNYVEVYASRIYAYCKMLSIRVRERIWHWRVNRLKNLNRRTRIISIITLALLFFAYFEVVRPPAAFPTESLVSVTKGLTLQEVAEELESQSVVRNAWWLEMLIRARGGDRTVHAGDYLFKHPRNIFSVARIISIGAFGLEPIKITVAEGATIADMAVIYDRRLLRFDPEKFFLLALDLEGYLFPDTYHFLPNATEEEVIQVMRDNFDQQVKIFAPQLIDSPYDLHEVVTMASIIEREAWNDRDRRLISGVLWNRIERGMRLQVDATFFYTHDKGTYGITLAELKDETNPYNTYVHKGLPPGPIAAPGISSLAAALNPIENDYLFYLADRTGVTYYSETYDEHLRKKRIYVD